MYLDLRYKCENGDLARVIVADDVVSLPDDCWSLAGFGETIDLGWLVGRFPGVRDARRRLCAELVRTALRDVHGHKTTDCPKVIGLDELRVSHGVDQATVDRLLAMEGTGGSRALRASIERNPYITGIEGGRFDTTRRGGRS